MYLLSKNTRQDMGIKGDCWNLLYNESNVPFSKTKLLTIWNFMSYVSLR